MSQQAIKRSQRIRIFLLEYYFGHSIWRNTVRLIGGPLLIWYGVRFYHKADKFAIAYGGFCFLYGIYFVLKPFLIIALRPALFRAETFTLTVTEQELQ